MFVLLCFSLVACSKNIEAQAVAIIAPEVFSLETDGADLPEIKLLYDNGAEKVVLADEFWFIGANLFVQDNKIFVKTTAPYIFEDEMVVIYRQNTDIETTINIVKEYIPLASITLSAADNATTCKQGESLQINAAFLPLNASDKGIVYEIVQGDEFADIDNSGLLTVRELATVDAEIQIKAVAAHTNLPPEIVDNIDRSNIITVKVSKSYDVIVVPALTGSVYVPTKEEFAFYGYYAGKNGTGIKYFNYKGNAVSEINVEIKLYACWVAVATGKIYQYNGNSVRSDKNNGRKYTKYTDIGLDFEKLKEIGYTKVNVTIDLELRAHNVGDGRSICMDLSTPADMYRIWEVNNVNVYNTEWNHIENGDSKYYYTAALAIDNFDNGVQYRYGFETESYFLTDAVWYYNESYTTFTAAK
jgi:hypothetical protein